MLDSFELKCCSRQLIQIVRRIFKWKSFYFKVVCNKRKFGVIK
ncbi:hypothetical protein HMPREF1402_00535 [Helicobacter pylori GAM121Aii]|nr:hypothetical protein HMPREF1402_00535 [Helicobacter pylori GAM121Aii]EMH24138.1 hypothetical protein HMPREF1419_00944 [Helicobacter pylori GAM263BFi]